MYLAMSRLQIMPGKENEFETVWKSRETHLEGVKGFKKFNLIKDATNKEFSLYVSHSEWNSEKEFWDWTRSDSFRLAHKDAAFHKDIYLEPLIMKDLKLIL